ncbi:MAG: bacillithiol biosynthesis BshC, partial [Meiothermus sp.]|nr:bacillithiol biosynthesis BshC [Meiothermus sp.]
MPDPLHPFLPYGLESLPALLRTPRDAPREALRAGLVAYLQRLGAPKASLEAAERLAHPNSRVVVSGQQAGLLTGPAYTFYKAHAALKLAQEFQHQSSKNLAVAPVAQHGPADALAHLGIPVEGAQQVADLAKIRSKGNPPGGVSGGELELQAVYAFFEVQQVHAA